MYQYYFVYLWTSYNHNNILLWKNVLFVFFLTMFFFFFFFNLAVDLSDSPRVIRWVLPCISLYANYKQIIQFSNGDTIQFFYSVLKNDFVILYRVVRRPYSPCTQLYEKEAVKIRESQIKSGATFRIAKCGNYAKQRLLLIRIER